MVFLTQAKELVCKSLVKARKPWLLLVIKRVVRHIFPACFGKICAASGVDCQSSADTVGPALPNGGSQQNRRLPLLAL